MEAVNVVLSQVVNNVRQINIVKHEQVAVLVALHDKNQIQHNVFVKVDQ